MRREVSKLIAGAAVLLMSVSVAVCAHASERGLTRIESEKLFAQNENYAVVVGIDRYEMLPALRHARDDAERLAALFREQGYTVFELLDYEANERRVLAAIEKAGRLATNEGRARQGNVVFAFAGHGFRDGRRNYLATGETDPADLADTALALSKVSDRLDASGVRQRVLLIDACRNVPGARSSGNPEHAGFAPDEDAEGMAVLYSTGARQLSFEDPELGQGVFTHYVAEGLGGEAAGGDGLVTFERLRRYVEGKVKRHVIEAFGEVQVPYVGGERTGEFVLARMGPGVIGRPESRREAEPTPTVKVGRLTVRPEPGDARVRIMDIGPRYHDGIELALGRTYDVLVEHEGYEPWRGGVTLDDAEQRMEVTLVRSDGRESTRAVERQTFESARPPESAAKAMRYYRGCEDGVEHECTYLGVRYQIGIETEVDVERAVPLYERGCDGGDPRGCLLLGNLYAKGLGVSQDEARAAKLIERTCDGRLCVVLGVQYATGSAPGGILRDEELAARLYRRGCETGDAFGCSNLGFLYETGRGVSRDETRAKSLFKRGCDGGAEPGCNALERLKGG